MFKDLSRYSVDASATSWLDMPELGVKARICLAPASEANPNYYNAMLKLSSKRVRRMARTDEITAEDAAQSRDEDRQLYPRFVIRGWECVEGEPGAEGVDDSGFVPYSRAAAQELCALLPDHLMDRIRNHAATVERFYGEQPDAGEIEELAGN